MPGSAHDANTASATRTSSRPGNPQSTWAPELRSTVLTRSRRGRSRNVRPADQPAEQQLQRFPPIDCGCKHPAQCHVGTGNGENVTALHLHCALPHLLVRHAGGPGRGDHRAHAGADDQAGYQAALLERHQHAEMGQPLQSPTTQDQLEVQILSFRCVSASVNAMQPIYWHTLVRTVIRVQLLLSRRSHSFVIREPSLHETPAYSGHLRLLSRQRSRAAA